MKGNNTWAKCDHKEEVAKAISLKLKGVPKSPETRAKMSKARQNIPIPKETRLKISKTLTGRTTDEYWTPEQRYKHQKSLIGLYKPEGFGEQLSEKLKGNFTRPEDTTTRIREGKDTGCISRTFITEQDVLDILVAIWNHDNQRALMEKYHYKTGAGISRIKFGERFSDITGLTPDMARKFWLEDAYS